MHNKTGVKMDVPMHRLFVVNKDNKIKNMNDILNNIRDILFSVNEKHEINERKINLIMESVNQIANEMGKPEEIVLINN